MSLVAYGSSSDENSDEDEIPESVENVEGLVKRTRTLNLPAPKDAVDTTPDYQLNGTENNERELTKNPVITTTDEPTLFKNLPKPKHIEIGPTDEVEDEIVPPKIEKKPYQEKSVKKNRGPVKISLPSLSEFKDVEEEEEERKRNRIKPSEKGTGLFAILPPPKGSLTKATARTLIPDIVKKVSQPPRSVQQKQVKNIIPNNLNIKNKTPFASINYDSDSDEESIGQGGVKDKVGEKVLDFFSLTNSGKLSPTIDNSKKDFFSLSEEQETISTSSVSETYVNVDKNYHNDSQVSQVLEHKVGSEMDKREHTILLTECGHERKEGAEISDRILTSNVINLPKEEIKLKNKAEIGPKLPIPEQEYNVDSQGNVAFDEKAIEYLCGKRGVKRKNKDFDEANIIEISGEDIKPDEREWLVKALTEEPAERPVSMEGAGPSTQSRKKHQITYLAHQAKAMEVELKNQWAQNRVTRKQTQSKYGF